MDKEMFLGVARLNSEEFPMGCAHVNLCVLAENQWAACKKAEEHLKKHFYYGKGELIFWSCIKSMIQNQFPMQESNLFLDIPV